MTRHTCVIKSDQASTGSMENHYHALFSPFLPNCSLSLVNALSSIALHPSYSRSIPHLIHQPCTHFSVPVPLFPLSLNFVAPFSSSINALLSRSSFYLLRPIPITSFPLVTYISTTYLPYPSLSLAITYFLTLSPSLPILSYHHALSISPLLPLRPPHTLSLATPLPCLG